MIFFCLSLLTSILLPLHHHSLCAAYLFFTAVLSTSRPDITYTGNISLHCQNKEVWIFVFDLAVKAQNVTSPSLSHLCSSSFDPFHRSLILSLSSLWLFPPPSLSPCSQLINLFCFCVALPSLFLSATNNYLTTPSLLLPSSNPFPHAPSTILFTSFQSSVLQSHISWSVNINKCEVKEQVRNPSSDCQIYCVLETHHHFELSCYIQSIVL